MDFYFLVIDTCLRGTALLIGDSLVFFCMVTIPVLKAPVEGAVVTLGGALGWLVESKDLKPGVYCLFRTC